MSSTQADVHAALSGDDLAYTRLFRSVEGEIRQILRLELRSRRDIDVEEAIQDVFIYMTKKLDIYDSRYAFATFAKGLTRTIAKRYKARKTLGGPAVGFEGNGELTEELLYAQLSEASDRKKRLIGFDRVIHSGTIPAPSQRFTDTLELILVHGGYPHQQIAFGFNILIFGKQKRTLGNNASFRRPEIFGDPERVVSEIGPLTLREASLELSLEIQNTMGPTFDVSPLFECLASRLQKTGAELFEKDATSLRHLPHLKSKNIANTHLKEYFGKDPKKSVTDWSHAVRKRLKRLLTAESGLHATR